MQLIAQIAKHFRDVHFGGNWTSINLKNTLTGVTWQQATTTVHDFNTIAVLVYHMHYYIRVVLVVLDGGPLDAHDKYSFELPPLQSQAEWDQMLEVLWADAERFANLVEQLPESKLWEDFTDKKYGNYYRNFHGIIEHCHYHLGQIVLIKKILARAGDN